MACGGCSLCEPTDAELRERFKMGEFDDGFEDEGKPAIDVVTMYQIGHTDGYTHTHGGLLYRSYAVAEAIGIKQDGAYSVKPKAVPTITLPDGRTFIVEGPIKTADEIEEEKFLRGAALKKLTAVERRLLGLEDP